MGHPSSLNNIIIGYTTYGDLTLFDGDPFAQSIPLTKILPRITSIHEKSQVVCTLRHRFTNICSTFSESEMFIDSGYNYFSVTGIFIYCMESQ
jgi:hypothetical protein